MSIIVIGFLLVVSSSAIDAATFNIQDYGAKGDGDTDDRKALKQAWQAACKEESAVLSIPAGKTYLISQVSLEGPCQSDLVLKIRGNIQAPDASTFSDNTMAWIRFKGLKGFTVDSTGTVDGAGKSWWSCSSCSRKAPTAVEFNTIQDLQVNRLYVKNSPRAHIHLNNCQGATLQSVRINSPSDSPNTDGIHLTNSQGVTINDAVVAAGDDCVSIVAGCSDIKIDTITCGPGHGISIGSLGGGGTNNVEDVSNVQVSNAKLVRTTNGVRIKTYKTGRGSVSDVTFSDVTVDDVKNPIIIDQEYCDKKSHKCASEISAKDDSVISISNVKYKNISGTSKSKVALTFKCSPVVGCTEIELDNIQLTQTNRNKGSNALCENASGTTMGKVVPESCLTNEL